MTAPFHGYKVLGHVTKDDGTIVVLVDRSAAYHDRYVTGCARTLRDPEWYWGAYYVNRNAAARNMLERAGVWAGTTTC